MRGPSIRTLLFGAHAFVWLIPLFALGSLRIYDLALLRQTEHQLIAESVVLGEAFRAAYLAELGKRDDRFLPKAQGRYPSDTFFPVTAQIDFGHAPVPAAPPVLPERRPVDTPSVRAGRTIEPLMQRAQHFNLSGVRVLDHEGCVVATTRSELHTCMRALPEVRSALEGRYRAVLRERLSDEPAPPLGDIRRRGRLRVFTALPIFSDGRVIAVVRASRTGLDAVSSLWANRRGLLWLASGLALLLTTISLVSSAAIVGPLRRLTRAARAVHEGRGARGLALTGPVPSEIAQLSEVLSAMAARLEQRAHYVEDFARQVSHELKTPITAIRGAAELLHQGQSDMAPADRQRFLENVLADAARMERLVTRLLELARAENRAPDPALPELDAVAVVRALVARHGARIELVAPERFPLAMAEEQLVSVVGNLVENALRHGEDKPVEVRLAPEGERLRIEVSDFGKGVSEANQKRLFERFFTTERDRGGTGLGLAIVKAIAEARGGSVAAEFSPGPSPAGSPTASQSPRCGRITFRVVL